MIESRIPGLEFVSYAIRGQKIAPDHIGNAMMASVVQPSMLLETIEFIMNYRNQNVRQTPSYSNI